MATEIEHLKMVHAQMLTGKSIPWTPPVDDQYPIFSDQPWFDRTKWRKSRRLLKENFNQVLQAMVFSLTMGFSIEVLLRPLILTKNTNTTSKASVRYLSTLKHVLTWYLHDPVTVARDVKIVNRIHHSVAKSIDSPQKDTETKSSDDLHFTQYTMSVVQSGFFFAILMHGPQLGMRLSQDELEALIHVWRVVGYCAGIHDSYNLCVPEDVTTVENKCKAIVEFIINPALSEPSDDFLFMSNVYTESMNLILPFQLPFFSHLPILLWSINTVMPPKMAAKVKQLYPMTLTNWIQLCIYRALFNIHYYCDWMSRHWYNPWLLNKFCSIIELPLGARD